MNSSLKSDCSNNQNVFNNLSTKRLSFIDRGKSWAKQLIKSNKLSNSPSLMTHKSFDSCDSGIDMNTSTQFGSNASKISTSSSCSFITSYNSAASDTSTTKSTNSSTILSSNSDPYDQVYSSAQSNSSSSKTSSSNYLISPLDESGYLVPIFNLSLSNQANSNNYKTQNSSILTRSFSTRSAYSSNQNQNNSSKQFNSKNRVTICEQISLNNSNKLDGLLSNNYCIKCNSKLGLETKMEEDLIKSNQAYNLFDSFTCGVCLSSVTENSNKNLKVPQIPAPKPPNLIQIANNPPPPLPTQPPPSLLNYTNQTNFKITPLYICKNENNQIVLSTLNNNINNNTKQIQSSCNCSCNFCTLNLKYLNSTVNTNNNLLRSSTPDFDKEINLKDSIIYIDSQEESNHEMNNLINKLKLKTDENEQRKSNELLKQNMRQKVNNNNNNNIQNHDYHSIKNLTPSNSVESFEFLNLNENKSKENDLIASYEKSWENSSTIILLNNLSEKLNLNQQPVNLKMKINHANTNNLDLKSNCSSLRHKKSSSSFLLHNNNNTTTTNNNNNNNHQRISLTFENNYPINNIDQPFKNTIKHSQSFLTKSNDKQLLSNSDDIEKLLSKEISINESHSDLSIDVESLNELWYQPNMPRENVSNYLIEREIGSFLIRLSNSCKNCFALSIRVPYFANQNGIAHYLITRNEKGYKLKGVEKEFKTLKSLVTHYSVMQEILPVTLNLTNNSSQQQQQQQQQQQLNLNNSKNCVINNFNQNFIHQQYNVKNVSCLIK